MSATDELVVNNSHYADSFQGPKSGRPTKKVAIVACMDARLDTYTLLGLNEGEAHVIRNAGGVITEDEIRSLAISQRLLGTEEIMLIHHTECGMVSFDAEEFKSAIEQDTGVRPSWDVETFSDAEEDVRRSAERIQSSPFVPRKDSIRGFVFDVTTGKLNEVR